MKVYVFSNFGMDDALPPCDINESLLDIKQEINIYFVHEISCTIHSCLVNDSQSSHKENEILWFESEVCL